MPRFPGRVLRSLTSRYRIISPLKGSSVFKAEVLSGPHVRQQWAVLKCATTEDEVVGLIQEQENYGFPEIASSPFVRKLLDTINTDGDPDLPPVPEGKTPLVAFLVLEWLDGNLTGLSESHFRDNPALAKAVAYAVLKALVASKRAGRVNTDLNPNNIFVSDPTSATPLVKVGDLGGMTSSGYRETRCQPVPLRAPEVWAGTDGCIPASEIWALAVTLLRVVTGDSVFGAWDKPIKGHSEAWCIAKFVRFFFLSYIRQQKEPPYELPEPTEEFPEYEDQYELAAYLALSDKFWNDGKDVMDMRERLVQLPTAPSKELMEFLLFLLIPDPARRPTAEEALVHPFLKDVGA
ncbi:kinase-like domain-containing protein [Phyllosticta capitalensis]|uniref:kinase-like domain-containing protein n=1 Tax=Phyllosticta capitalensis TaxID=121624 RepID=UPI00312D74F3